MLVEQTKTKTTTEPELDTRQRLLRAAIDVFLEKGFGGTRVQDIARRAGYTAGALYVHFPSRTALLGEAILLEGQRIISLFVAKIEESTPGEMDIAALLTDAVLTSPDNLDRLIIEALALAGREQEARDMLSTSIDGLVELATTRLEARRDAGALDPSLDIDAVRVMFGVLILGAVMHRTIVLPVAKRPQLLEVFGRAVGSLGEA